MPGSVDINCDMGESFGAWSMGDDGSLLRYVSSASVACGFHAGDPRVMRETVARVRDAGVSLGAHPGLPDLGGFGRRRMDVSVQDAYDMVVYQVGALAGFASAAGVPLRHVKPHGALYNMAAENRELAEAIARAVRDVDSSLRLFGLSGSELIAAATAAGLASVSEVFADRAYTSAGALVSREHANALVRPSEAGARAVKMVREGVVDAIDGVQLRVVAETICVHGDGPDAVEIARQLRAALEAAGLEIRASGS
jgi:5-oxoprolinase (ATP-hydrolysing) subunit A